MMVDPLLPTGAERRRAGTFLLAYGVLGVVLMGGLLLLTLFAGIRGQDSLDSLDAARDEIVTVLDSTIAALDAAAITLDGVSTTLADAAGAIEATGRLTGSAADSVRRVAEESGSFSTLGQHPFEGVAAPLTDVAADLDALGESLSTVGASLPANSEQVAALAARLQDLAASLAVTRDRLAGIPLDLGGALFLGTVVLATLIIWMMLPALAAIVLGRRWRRAPASTTGSSGG